MASDLFSEIGPILAGLVTVCSGLVNLVSSATATDSAPASAKGSSSATAMDSASASATDSTTASAADYASATTTADDLDPTGE